MFSALWLVQDFQAFEDALEGETLEEFLKLKWRNPAMDHHWINDIVQMDKQ